MLLLLLPMMMTMMNMMTMGVEVLVDWQWLTVTRGKTGAACLLHSLHCPAVPLRSLVDLQQTHTQYGD